MMYRRVAAFVMLLSASGVMALIALVSGLALAPAPRPVDRSVMFCAPRAGLAETFHPCRDENELVNL